VLEQYRDFTPEQMNAKSVNILKTIAQQIGCSIADEKEKANVATRIVQYIRRSRPEGTQKETKADASVPDDRVDQELYETALAKARSRAAMRMAALSTAVAGWDQELGEDDKQRDGGGEAAAPGRSAADAGDKSLPEAKRKRPP